MSINATLPRIFGPLERLHIGDVSGLYFRRCKGLQFQNPQIAEEYLRRYIESRSHLHGYAIRLNGKIVGSSYMVKAGANQGVLLFTVTDESFTGPERMIAFGKAYRETIKALIAKGINSVQSSATKDNKAIIDYSFGTGYIKFAETDSNVYFEIYLSLLASVISHLSGISLDEISLLKLADIAANPKEDTDSAYVFNFNFKDRHYGLAVDKLSHELESISCPEFSTGFKYSTPVVLTSEKLRVFFKISNSTDCTKEFKCVVRVYEPGAARIVLKVKRLLEPGSSARFPLEHEFGSGGIKTFRAEVFTGQKRLRLSKAFVVKKPFRVTLNTSEARAGHVVLDILNVSGTKIGLKAMSVSAKGNPLVKKSSLAVGAMESLRLTDADRKTPDSLIRRLYLKTVRGNATTTLSISKNGGTTHFTDGEMFLCTNKHIVMSVEKCTGIVSFRDATVPKCMIFQLHEELGPPFTEYELNRFQSLPTSYRMPASFLGSFPFPPSNDSLKPRVRISDDGLAVNCRLEGRRGLLLEKKVVFKERDLVEIHPKILNNSGEDIHGRIAIRTCLKIMADTTIRAPIYQNSSPAKSRLSDNPYYIDELLLNGSRLTENWAAFEFPESNNCVGLIWQGNPKYDFFPLWFNKMPWLMYDLNLKDGEEMALPPLLITFKNGSWEAIRNIWGQGEEKSEK
jgi:hypothetical protein